jgi:hypothetical protein
MEEIFGKMISKIFCSASKKATDALGENRI